jgi:hypothetical protein
MLAGSLLLTNNGSGMTIDDDANYDRANIADVQSRLPAALVGGRMSSDVGSINASVQAAANLALSAGEIYQGTVDHTGFTATTTIFEADDITTAAADHWKPRYVIFTSGTLKGHAAEIEAYALNLGRGRFTVAAMPSAPADDVTFIIV